MPPEAVVMSNDKTRISPLSVWLSWFFSFPFLQNVLTSSPSPQRQLERHRGRLVLPPRSVRQQETAATSRGLSAGGHLRPTGPWRRLWPHSDTRSDLCRRCRWSRSKGEMALNLFVFEGSKMEKLGRCMPVVFTGTISSDSLVQLQLQMKIDLLFLPLVIPRTTRALRDCSWKELESSFSVCLVSSFLSFGKQQLTCDFVCVRRNLVTVWPLSPARAVCQCWERPSRQVCTTPAGFIFIFLNKKAFRRCVREFFVYVAVSSRVAEAVHHPGGGAARCGRWKAWCFTEQARCCFLFFISLLHGDTLETS